MTRPTIVSRRSPSEYAGGTRPLGAVATTAGVAGPTSPSPHAGHASDPTAPSSRPGDQTQTADQLAAQWEADPRWAGLRRDYTAQDVVALRGSVHEEHTLARRGAERLWDLVHTEEWVPALGAFTGNQAVQQVRAGLKAIYLSGWQVAADANLSGQTYPDQSLYPANSVPAVVRRINNALLRADQIETAESPENRPGRDWLAPIVADAEAGFGGPLNAYELMRSMIAAGAAGVHWEDQLASEKKCGHLGGKVLVPTSQHVRTLNAARLAADVAGVPSVIIARTDSLAADLLTSDVDERDRPFLTGERTSEGFYRVRPGEDAVIARGLAYAPYSDLIWVETGTPDLGLARRFAEAVHAEHPDKKLAYNCSPSFNWRKHLDDAQIASFQKELASMGYAFQFITLAGFHAVSHSMFELARGYHERAMTAYVELQEAEFASEADGYTATRHQREVGTGYFDRVATALNPDAATLALAGSTETAQFH
ncbi:isocitrate lyase [Cellulosimicrobium marinum]|uniref:isocitrate lyase n=1 Tax=Cellulosimicrobium marinum TaxID=1638992 RepID=UPI001E3A28E6|nr:isocitrate lyase [Cellulosimicrobium marinum]MCB7136563.1 isocitrate lyase [Cellulosimicrobium marinum]